MTSSNPSPEVTDSRTTLSGAWPSVLANLKDVMEAHFRRRGHAAPAASAASDEAREAVLELAHYFGGRPIYLPRGDRLKIELRDQELYQRFNGSNASELSDEYRITIRHVQRIIKAQMERKRMSGAPLSAAS